MTCYKYGKVGHKANDCKSVAVVCYNYGEIGHISTNCQKPKKTEDVKAKGNIFALSVVEASKFDNLIRGTCFINGIHLITIIDMGATHSFISTDV